MEYQKDLEEEIIYKLKQLIRAFEKLHNDKQKLSHSSGDGDGIASEIRERSR